MPEPTDKPTPPEEPKAPETAPAADSPAEPAKGPATSDIEPNPAKSRKMHRLQIGTNVIVQIALLAVLVLVANYLSARHFERWDLSRDQKYSLSPKTVSLLEALDEPIEVIVRLRASSRVTEDVRDLLQEMQYVAGDRLSVEYMNPELDVSREKALQAKYAFREANDLVIIRNPANDQNRFVYENEMIQLAPLDPYKAMAEVEADIAAFTGEQQIASALIEVIEETKPKVYFTQGHNEVPLGEESPISLFLEKLGQENLEPAEIRLMELETMPDDAAVVVIISPKYDFTLQEVQLLEDYWAAGGRILMMLDPRMWTTNLEEFTKRRAIEPRTDQVIKTLQINEEFGFLVPDVTTQFVPDSIITQGLEKANATLKGGTQSLGLSGELAEDLELTLSGLMFATEGYWGEIEPDAKPPKYDEGKDHTFPLAVAAAVEPANKDETHPRLVVIGNGAMIQNESTNAVINDFLLNTMNWLLDRNFLIGIPPRERNLSMLTLTGEQKGQIWFYCVILIPIIPAGAGVLVWLKRRR